MCVHDPLCVLFGHTRNTATEREMLVTIGILASILLYTSRFNLCVLFGHTRNTATDKGMLATIGILASIL